ncbi:MAG: hypothetical protein P8075_09400 [Deltaproteobacteria bacterium]|jgi:hypothetical protein
MSSRTFLRWQIVFLIALATCFFSSFARADTAKAKPVVEIPSPRYDAGSHWEGEVVTHAFKVKNTGSSELRILSVKPG